MESDPFSCSVTYTSKFHFSLCGKIETFLPTDLLYVVWKLLNRPLYSCSCMPAVHLCEYFWEFSKTLNETVFVLVQDANDRLILWKCDDFNNSCWRCSIHVHRELDFCAYYSYAWFLLLMLIGHFIQTNNKTWRAASENPQYTEQHL